MKRALITASLGTALAVASSAAADMSTWNPALDQVLLLNGGMPIFLDSAGANNTYSEVFFLDNPHPVVGFSFAGVAALGLGTWASDTRLDITAPDGTTYAIGGSGAGAAPNGWDFQGPVSAFDGLYVHGLGAPPYGGNNADGLPALVFDKIDKTGFWQFTLTQTEGSVVWKGTSLNLHKIPAPGAIALFIAAGLLGSKRRRT